MSLPLNMNVRGYIEKIYDKSKCSSCIFQFWDLPSITQWMWAFRRKGCVETQTIPKLQSHFKRRARSLISPCWLTEHGPLCPPWLAAGSVRSNHCLSRRAVSKLAPDWVDEIERGKGARGIGRGEDIWVDQLLKRLWQSVVFFRSLKFWMNFSLQNVWNVMCVPPTGRLVLRI